MLSLHPLSNGDFLQVIQSVKSSNRMASSLQAPKQKTGNTTFQAKSNETKGLSYRRPDQSYRLSPNRRQGHAFGDQSIDGVGLSQGKSSKASSIEIRIGMDSPESKTPMKTKLPKRAPAKKPSTFSPPNLEACGRHISPPALHLGQQKPRPIRKQINVANNPFRKKVMSQNLKIQTNDSQVIVPHEQIIEIPLMDAVPQVNAELDALEQLKDKCSLLSDQVKSERSQHFLYYLNSQINHQSSKLEGNLYSHKRKVDEAKRHLKKVEAKTEVIQALAAAAERPEPESKFFQDVSMMQNKFTYHKFKANFQKTMKLRKEHELFKKQVSSNFSFQEAASPDSKVASTQVDFSGEASESTFQLPELVVRQTSCSPLSNEAFSPSSKVSNARVGQQSDLKQLHMSISELNRLEKQKEVLLRNRQSFNQIKEFYQNQITKAAAASSHRSTSPLGMTDGYTITLNYGPVLTAKPDEVDSQLSVHHNDMEPKHYRTKNQSHLQKLKQKQKRLVDGGAKLSSSKSVSGSPMLIQSSVLNNVYRKINVKRGDISAKPVKTELPASKKIGHSQSVFQMPQSPTQALVNRNADLSMLESAKIIMESKLNKKPRESMIRKIIEKSKSFDSEPHQSKSNSLSAESVEAKKDWARLKHTQMTSKEESLPTLRSVLHKQGSSGQDEEFTLIQRSNIQESTDSMEIPPGEPITKYLPSNSDLNHYPSRNEESISHYRSTLKRVVDESQWLEGGNPLLSNKNNKLMGASKQKPADSHFNLFLNLPALEKQSAIPDSTIDHKKYSKFFESGSGWSTTKLLQFMKDKKPAMNPDEPPPPAPPSEKEHATSSLLQKQFQRIKKLNRLLLSPQSPQHVNSQNFFSPQAKQIKQVALIPKKKEDPVLQGSKKQLNIKQPVLLTISSKPPQIKIPSQERLSPPEPTQSSPIRVTNQTVALEVEVDTKTKESRYDATLTNPSQPTSAIIRNISKDIDTIITKGTKVIPSVPSRPDKKSYNQGSLANVLLADQLDIESNDPTTPRIGNIHTTERRSTKSVESPPEERLRKMLSVESKNKIIFPLKESLKGKRPKFPKDQVMLEIQKTQL